MGFETLNTFQKYNHFWIILKQSLWDLKRQNFQPREDSSGILKQSLWDLKPIFPPFCTYISNNFEAVPMGFET